MECVLLNGEREHVWRTEGSAHNVDFYCPMCDQYAEGEEYDRLVRLHHDNLSEVDYED